MGVPSILFYGDLHILWTRHYESTSMNLSNSLKELWKNSITKFGVLTHHQKNVFLFTEKEVIHRIYHSLMLTVNSLFGYSTRHHSQNLQRSFFFTKCCSNFENAKRFLEKK